MLLSTADNVYNILNDNAVMRAVADKPVLNAASQSVGIHVIFANMKLVPVSSISVKDVRVAQVNEDRVKINIFVAPRVSACSILV